MTREYSLHLIKMEERHSGLAGSANEKILLERTCNIIPIIWNLLDNAYISPFVKVAEIEIALTIFFFFLKCCNAISNEMSDG